MTQTDGDGIGKDDAQKLDVGAGYETNGQKGGLSLGERLLWRGGDYLQASGVLVFVFSAFSCLLFLLTSSTFGFMEDWARLRTVQIFAMVAAVGVVVAIMSGSKNAFVLAFGILLIGALIVPTKDMVALALLASGRDFKSDKEERRFDDGAEFKGRATDLANKIISELQNAPRVPRDLNAAPVLGPLSSPERGQAILAVEKAINDDRRIGNLDRARLAGSIPLLMSFADNDRDGSPDFQEYYFRFGTEPDFVDDLLNLRRQEMVQFSYSEFSNASITYYGKEVICEYFKQVENSQNSCPFADVQGDANEVSARLTAPNSPEVRSLDFCRNSSVTFFERNTGGDLDRTAAVPFAVALPIPRISETEEISIVLELSSDQTAADSVRNNQFIGKSDSDPYLTILRRTLSQNNGAFSCEVIASDDDTAGDFNSRIRWPIPVGSIDPSIEYIAIAQDILGRPSQMKLSIRIEPSPASQSSGEGAQ